MTKSKFELENEGSVESPVFDSLFNLFKKGVMDADEIYSLLGLSAANLGQKLKEEEPVIKDTICEEERS